MSLLDLVEYAKLEITIDADDMSDEQVAALKQEAADRGLHVSGTRRWILVRQLVKPFELLPTPAR